MRWLLLLLTVATGLAQEGPVATAIEALERNDFAAAVPLLREAAELEPQNPSIPFNLGFALSQLGEDEGAVSAYLKALEIQPNLPQAWPNLGVLLVRIGRSEEAIQYLEKAIERRPDDPQLHYFYAHALVRSQNEEQAIAAYQRAGVLDPTEPSIWIELGQVQARLERFDAAATSFRRAGQLEQELSSYLLQLAEQIELGGGQEQALELYQEYLAIDPNHLGVRERVGMLLLDLERYDQAAAELGKVVEAGPTDAARMALAQAYASANDSDTAREKWAEAVAANPDEPELRVRYAASLIQATEYEAAGEQYVAALKMNDQNATAWAGLAFALHKVENYSASLDALINSNALRPLNAASLYLRAITEDRLLMQVEAKASYEAFLAAGSGLENEEWKARQRLRAIELAMEQQ